MHYRIEFGGDPQDVTITTSGVADVVGFTAFTEALVEHPEFRPGMAILLDHTDLDTSLLTAADVVAIAEHLRTLECRLGDARAALIVPDAFAFGLARFRVREAQFERFDPQTFATREEAVAWLSASRR